MQFTRPNSQRPPQLADPRLVLITDDQGRTLDDLTAIILQAIEGGVTMVHFREKSLSPTQAFDAINHLAAALSKTDVPLIINSDILETLESAPPYDGIHYTSRGWSRRQEPDGRIVGWSAHSAGEIHAVTLEQASYITISPVFDTPSKQNLLEPLGLDNLAKYLSREPSVPVVALGGIDITNAANCITAGADGIAVMRAIMSAIDPKQAATDLRKAVETAMQ